MRIVGGRFRGRSLVAPNSQNIRPTTDRTRESLFNILSNKFEFSGKRVIDLFAGTGALGLEAISRGCNFALFVEQSAEGRALLRQNIETLGLQGNSRIFKRDATKLGDAGPIQPFDIVFLDPPYSKGLGEKAIAELLRGNWLCDNAIVILEEDRRAMPEIIDGLVKLDLRQFGDSAVQILEKQ